MSCRTVTYMVWSYRYFTKQRPDRLRTAWAYAPSYDGGASYLVAKARSGFTTQQEAIDAAEFNQRRQGDDA